MKNRTTDTQTHRPADSEPANPAKGFFQKTGFYFLAGLVLVVLGATLVAATQVDASSWRHGSDDQDNARERIGMRAEFAVDWILDRIDATEEQSQTIKQIVTTSLDEFHEMHEANAESHERLAALLTAQTIDPAALEAFRSEQMEKFETASNRLTESVTAIAAELTAEQRVELAEFVKKHHGRHGHGRSHH